MTDDARDGQADFIKQTTGFWQEILPPDDGSVQQAPPYRFAYPAVFPDGRRLILPLRRLPGTNRAVASLIANQASFTVVDALADVMAAFARDAGAEQVVGMPTLGLAFAPRVAQHLGLNNYIPLGYSRKFWYRDDLSEPVHSITTPGQGKSVFIDPNILPRLAGRRVAVIDDAISTGSTFLSVHQLLARLDCEIATVVVAMRQGTAWRENLTVTDPNLPTLVRGVIAAPLFEFGGDGWYPLAGTLDCSRQA